MNFRQVRRFGLDGINVEIRVWQLIRGDVGSFKSSQNRIRQTFGNSIFGWVFRNYYNFYFYYVKAACDTLFIYLFI